MLVDYMLFAYVSYLHISRFIAEIIFNGVPTEHTNENVCVSLFDFLCHTTGVAGNVCMQKQYKISIKKEV